MLVTWGATSVAVVLFALAPIGLLHGLVPRPLLLEADTE